MMTGPVVVGIDDLEHSERLIAVAIQEAQQRGTNLVLAHACHGFTPAVQGVPPDVTPDQILRDNAQELLDGIAARITAEHPGLQVVTTAVAGPAASALAELAGSASVLIVGGRGRGGLAGQLLGSVSLGVLDHADCPVLVIRGTRETTEQRVMVGVDVGDPATGPEVLEFAFAEATRRHAHLYAFYAWEDPSILYAYSDRAFAATHREEALKLGREGLARAVGPWQQMYPQVEVSSAALAGLPARLLVEATDAADLVVIGGRARGRDRGMRIGGIAHTVLHHARCPVAIVPEH